MIDFQKIREEVAEKHNLTLDEKDPILVTVTLNKLMLEAYIKLISDHYSQANREITLSLQQQLNQSKETAGYIITRAANYVSEEIKKELNPIISEIKDHKNIISLKKCILFSIATSVLSFIITLFLIIKLL